MSASSRPHTPIFRFYGASDPDRNSTEDRNVTPDSSVPREFLGSPDRYLSLRSRPGRRIPRARSASPQYGFEDLSNFSFTFADGWIETPPSALDRATEARYQPEHPQAALKNGFTALVDSNFDQRQLPEFSLRLLHNVTPLPSREPSPQPADSSAVVLHTRPQNQSRVSDVSSLSILSGEDKSTPPYDVRSEGAPAHEFFTARFQVTLRKGLDIAKDTLQVLKRLDDHGRDDADLKKLLDHAYQLSAFEGSDTKTIAVLGDSGEGKSSLINSLLDFPGIAKTGDIGSACTSVVTEYRQKTREHTASITIEVEHLSAQAIEDVIGELVWNYRQLYLPRIVAEGPSGTDYPRCQRDRRTLQ